MPAPLTTSNSTIVGDLAAARQVESRPNVSAFRYRPKASNAIGADDCPKRFGYSDRRMMRDVNDRRTNICPVGFWTIGYGHLCDAQHPPITEVEAEAHPGGWSHGIDPPTRCTRHRKRTRQLARYPLRLLIDLSTDYGASCQVPRLFFI